jgi:hypothetical protein
MGYRLLAIIPAFPFMIFGVRFCFLSWLPPAIYWKKTLGKMLKRSE